MGGGRGGHVGHGLDDLGHKMGMACQLNLPSGVRDNCGEVLDNEGKSSRFQPAISSSNKTHQEFCLSTCVVLMMVVILMTIYLLGS